MLSVGVRHERFSCRYYQKGAVYLAADKRAWKAAGLIIAIVIAIALLPVMLLLAMGNQFSNADAQQIDYSQFVQNLSAE